MSISERYFSIGKQWNVIHLPSKPNGFAIFLIGDTDHFVKNDSCSWLANRKKARFIEQLRAKGYTIFSSNLYGKHFGNDEATLLAEQVYHLVIKKEILNHKVHLMTDGMGVLVALKLMKNLSSQIRSMTMINPNPYLYLWRKKKKDTFSWNEVPNAQVFQEIYTEKAKTAVVEKMRYAEIFHGTTNAPTVHFCKKGAALTSFPNYIYPFLRLQEIEL